MYVINLSADVCCGEYAVQYGKHRKWPKKKMVQIDSAYLFPKKKIPEIEKIIAACEQSEAENH